MSNAYEFDTEAMRERYRAERDKRLLSTGTDQYVFTDGKYQQFDTDPHAGPPPPRGRPSRRHAQRHWLWNLFSIHRFLPDVGQMARRWRLRRAGRAMIMNGETR